VDIRTAGRFADRMQVETPEIGFEAMQRVVVRGAFAGPLRKAGTRGRADLHERVGHFPIFSQ